MLTHALIAAMVIAPTGGVVDTDDNDGGLTADVCVELTTNGDDNDGLLGVLDDEDSGLSLAARVRIALDDDYRDKLVDDCDDLDLL